MDSYTLGFCKAKPNQGIHQEEAGGNPPTHQDILGLTGLGGLFIWKKIVKVIENGIFLEKKNKVLTTDVISI